MGRSFVLVISSIIWLALVDVVVVAQQDATQAGGNDRSETVRMPHVWMRAKEVLIAAHRQAGLKYAVVSPQFEMPVGPFSIEGPIGVQELIDRVGEVTSTNAHWIGDVIVFDPKVDTHLLESTLSSTASSLDRARGRESRDPSSSKSDPQESGRYSVERLAELEHSATIPRLSGLAGSADGSTQIVRSGSTGEAGGRFHEKHLARQAVDL